jgi:hypothetical protein
VKIADEARKSLAVIWLAFAVIFSFLAFFHWRLASSAMPPFSVPERPDPPNVRRNVIIKDIPIDKLLQDFAVSMNQYVQAQNESSHQSNLLSFCGYVVAAFTALVSAVIELFPRKPNQKTTE